VNTEVFAPVRLLGGGLPRHPARPPGWEDRPAHLLRSHAGCTDPKWERLQTEERNPHPGPSHGHRDHAPQPGALSSPHLRQVSIMSEKRCAGALRSGLWHGQETGHSMFVAGSGEPSQPGQSGPRSPVRPRDVFVSPCEDEIALHKAAKITKKTMPKYTWPHRQVSNLHSSVRRNTPSVVTLAAGRTEHVAMATVSGCRAIVSWNSRHIVHFEKIPLYNGVNMSQGFAPLAIHTPQEMVHYEDKDQDV